MKNSELVEKIENYRKELLDELKELEEVIKELNEKFRKGTLTSKENRNSKKISKRTDEINEQLDKFQEFDLYNDIMSSLKKYASTNTSQDKKNNFKEDLYDYFQKFNDIIFNNLQNSLGVELDKVSDLQNLKKEYETKLERLQTAYETLSEEEQNTSNIVQNIEELKSKLEQINNHIKLFVTKSDLNTDLDNIDNLNIQYKSATTNGEKSSITKKKNAIIKKYDDIVNVLIIDLEIDKIIDVYSKPTKSSNDDKQKNKKDFNDKKNKVSEFFKNHWPKIAGVAGTVALAVALIAIAKSCNNQIENTDLDNTPEPTGIEQTIEPTNEVIETLEPMETVEPTFEKLLNKGYDEYTVTIMLNNFSQDVIDKLIASPRIAKVENFATVKEFKLEYLQDYEDAREKYNIIPSEAVDYVNRSYLIQATRFYNDASISQIVEVVMAINDKKLFTQDNSNLAQSFNTSFNRITDNYLFGTVTEADQNKIVALQYFAKEGSDMDKFLTRFRILAMNILADPNNNDAKETMYNFINIFATSLNGFTNEQSVLTNDDEFNKDAQIIDYFDWYMIYESFIKPLYPIIFPTYPNAPASVPYIPEGATDKEKNDAWMELNKEWEKYIQEHSEEYAKINAQIQNLTELQMLMESALKKPELEQICGQGRTLGGN